MSEWSMKKSQWTVQTRKKEHRFKYITSLSNVVDFKLSNCIRQANLYGIGEDDTESIIKHFISWNCNKYE